MRCVALLAGLVIGCGARGVARDASDACDAANDTAPDAASLAAGRWTWIDVPGTACGYGGATGVGVNPGPSGHGELLVYLESGGACWDGASCLGLMPSASHLMGYDAAAFASEGHLVSNPLFARDDPANPFRDATWVYVPYCTGDLHAGQRVATYTYNGRTQPIHHAGASNLDAILPVVRSMIPAVDHVWLAGSAAGGYGAVLAWDHVARVFGTRIDVIDDAGPFLTEGDDLLPRWTASWGLVPPDGCTACQHDLQPWFAASIGRHPSARVAVLASTHDPIAAQSLRLADDAYANELDAWVDGVATSAAPTVRSFVVAATGHSLLVTPPPAGLMPWLTQMVDGDAAWTGVQP